MADPIRAQMADGTILEFPAGTPQGVIDFTVKRHMFEASLDKKTGAPGDVRMRVGAAPTPQDRLSTLRKTYPDAQAYGDDGNFVFRSPQTGRPTLYNPPGLDWGDTASILPELGEAAGGTIGGAVAALPGVAGAPFTGGASLAAIPAGIGLGAAAGRYGTELYANKVLGTDDTRSLLGRVGDVAGTAGMNAIGARAGDLIGQGVRSAVGPVRSALMGQTPRQVMDDFTSLGVRPTAGAVTGNHGVQMIEKSLGSLPGGSRVMQDIAKQQWDDIARAAGNITADIGQAGSPQQAGSVIRTGATKAADRFKEMQGALYDEAYREAGEKTPVNPEAVRGLMGDFERRLAEAPDSLNPAMRDAMGRTKALLGDSDKAPIGLDTWRTLRTNLGKDIDQPMLAGSTGAQNENLKRLYGAMSDDMRGTTDAAGPRARKLLDIADRYTRFNLNINMPTLQKIADMDADEKAFQWATSEAGKGGSRLMDLRKNLLPDEWRVVAASVFDRLGQATASARGGSSMGGEAGDFSVSTFMTNWNKLSPEAKDALFGARGMKETREAIDQLVRVTNRVKDVERQSNPSGTARHMLAGGSIALAGERALAGDIGGAAGVLGSTTVAPYITARMITNPTFVRWLAGAETFGKGASRDAMIGRLTAIAEANPEIRDETLRLQQVLSSSGAGESRR